MSVNKTWGGAFNEFPDDIMVEINQSISFDWVLYKQDIRGSIAHATMLARQNIITDTDRDLIIRGINDIEVEIEQQKFTFRRDLEDIHMNIESALFDKIGEAAKRLHTARSRNDQVAVDFKMFVRDAAAEVINLLEKLLKQILQRAEQNVETFMPAFTHLQTAQPIVFAHHLMCYYEMFLRDVNRFKVSLQTNNQSPLGTCALSGTSYNTDRHFTASELGFGEPCRNSLDGVSDRDFALEFLFNCSLVSLHLSRLMEEFVLWSTANFNFIKFSDKFSTGSSIMPQKKNPDAAELVRGKSGRVFGALITLLTVMKGLPLAYSKDMQEDKEPVFDCYKTIKICLLATIGMMSDFEVNVEAMRASAIYGHSTATDLADYLVQNFKLPFRQAHHITGVIVKLANEKKCNLWDLPLEEMQKIEPRITSDVFNVLTLETSVNSKKSYGGTAIENVKKMIELYRGEV